MKIISNPDKTTTLTLKELETRVMESSNLYKSTVNRVTSQIQSQHLNQGRV